MREASPPHSKALHAQPHRHLVAFDDELRLILSSGLKFLLPSESIVHHFEAYEGKALMLPEDGIHPSPSGHALMCQAWREAVGI